MTTVIHMHPPYHDRARDCDTPDWPEGRKGGHPTAKSQQNVATFLNHIGAEVFFDEFASRQMIRRDGVSGPLDDASMLRLYFEADALDLKPPREWFDSCVVNMANRNPVNEVRDAMNALVWDGISRIDGWLVRHAGGVDAAFDRAAFKLGLVAMVCRVLRPGCKFDQIIVLEGPQGGGKSSFLRILAGGDSFFTDALPIGANDRETLEIAHGKLIVELGELAGIGKRDLAAVKAFASRQADRARLAYGRTTTEVPRQFTIWGSTNDSEYLDDPTGNRRFWPLKVGRIDLARAAAERDQLIAEAAVIEALRKPLVLPESLWGDAAKAQQSRLISDTWEDAIAERLADFGTRAIKVTTGDVLTALSVPIERQDRQAQMRVAKLMQRLGFDKRSMGKGRLKGWARGEPGIAERIVCDELHKGFRLGGSL